MRESLHADKPPDNCDEPPQGADWGGPGYWRDVDRGDYDALWKRYEEQVTGVKRGHEYHYNDVDYDGYANEDGRHVFIEAKSRGYASQFKGATLNEDGSITVPRTRTRNGSSTTGSRR